MASLLALTGLLLLTLGIGGTLAAQKEAALRREAVTAAQAEEKQRKLATDKAAEAELERQRAVVAEKKATDNFKIAERNAYKTEATLARSNYYLSQARWNANRVGEARQLLKRVPQRHRKFEWHLTRRQFEVSDLTLYGHTSFVLSVSFSPDGTRILSQGRGGKQLFWDLRTGETLPDGNADEFAVGKPSNRSPDKRWFILPRGNDVLLVDLAYKNTPRERLRRETLARPKPRWHKKQFLAAQKAGEWYVATFHAAWLLKITPSKVSLRALQVAYPKLLMKHNGQAPPLPTVVLEMLKLLP